MYFWRTTAGSQVDLIIETQAGLVPIEVKASSTARPEMARGIQAFRRDFGDRAARGFGIYAVVFVHAEPPGEAEPAVLETRFVKNVKWPADRRGFKNIVLPSFTYPAKADASSPFAHAWRRGGRAIPDQVTPRPLGRVCKGDFWCSAQTRPRSRCCTQMRFSQSDGFRSAYSKG